DRLEVHLFGEVHGVADVIGAVGREDDGHRAVERRDERGEDDVVRRPRERLVLGEGGLSLLISRRVAEQVAQRIELRLADAVGVGVLSLLQRGGAGEAAAAEARTRQLDDERDARLDGHLGRRVAGEIDQRRLPGDDAAGRTRYHGGDADDAGDADVRAVRVDAEEGLRVRIERADLGDVDGRRGALRDL